MDKKIIPEIRAKLREPFPPEAITPHPTKTYLSTIKAAYVMERLNDVFGICGWEIEHEIVSDTDEYVSVRGCIHLTELDLRTSEQYGGHGKTGKNTEPADGYKSAVTDLMSKCASYLEIGIDVFKGVKASQARPQPKQAKPPADKTKHWCKEHDTAFFKKGRMKAYAHPLGDTGEWCHEHKEKPIVVEVEPAGVKTPPANGKVEEILQYVADQMKFANTGTAKLWLVNSMNIEEERINSDPEGVLKEVADLQGWNL